MLILPLLARGEVIGTIGLDLIELHEFTVEEVSLAFNAATSTAQSLANTRMFDQMQVTLAELQLLTAAQQQAKVEQSRRNQELALLNRVITAKHLFRQPEITIFSHRPQRKITSPRLVLKRAILANQQLHR